MTITAGDIVRLKSGGPLMTVDSVDAEDRFLCIWFDDLDLKWQKFTSASLRVLDPASIGLNDTNQKPS